MIRRRVTPKTSTPTLLEKEREARRERLATRVKLSAAGRPMCQHCGMHEAQNTGHRRADGSIILRKSNKLYTCHVCHSAKYGIPEFRGRKHDRVDEEAY